MTLAIILDFYGVIFDANTRQPMQGLKEFLELAQLQGLRFGVASSSPREHIREFLNEYQLQDYFQTIVGLNDVARTKPDTECYERVAIELEVSIPNALVVDDSLSAVAAAKQARFQTYYFDHTAASGLDNFKKISTLLNL